MGMGLIMYSNNCASITHYKDSLKGKIKDYVLRFNDTETNVKDIIDKSFDLVQRLVNDFHSKDQTIKGRLVARVIYQHMETEKIVSYYHPSFKSEIIEDVETFFMTHMLKIGQRMDSFNRHGSNLLIKQIDEIHFHFNIKN